MVFPVTSSGRNREGQTHLHFHSKALLLQRLQTSLKAPRWDCLQTIKAVCTRYAALLILPTLKPVSLSQQPVASVDTNPPVLSQTLAFTSQHMFLACLHKNLHFLSELQRIVLTYISIFIKFRFIRKHEMLLWLCRGAVFPIENIPALKFEVRINQTP